MARPYRKRYHKPRHRSRNRSIAGSMLSDTVEIATRLPWWGTLIFGILFFALFYWGIPLWLQSKLHDLEGNMFRPLIEHLYDRRIHWFQYVGIGIALICCLFATIRYFSTHQTDRSEQKQVSGIARFLARLWD